MSGYNSFVIIINSLICKNTKLIIKKIYIYRKGVIYPIAVHWAWSEQGWLYKLGFKDFAGGMMVHGLAGTACLMASILIGPRIGRFSNKKKNPPIAGHSSAVRIFEI